jgi:hypothetical protein
MTVDVMTNTIDSSTWKADTSYMVLGFFVYANSCWGIDQNPHTTIPFRGAPRTYPGSSFKLTHSTSTPDIVNRNIDFVNLPANAVVHLVFKKVGSNVHGAFYANGIRQGPKYSTRNNNCRGVNYYYHGGQYSRLLTQAELPANTTIGTKIIPSTGIAGIPAWTETHGYKKNIDNAGRALYGNWKHSYLLLTGHGGPKGVSPVFPENGGTHCSTVRKETDQWHATSRYGAAGGVHNKGSQFDGRATAGLVTEEYKRPPQSKHGNGHYPATKKSGSAGAKVNFPKEMHSPWLQDSDFVDLGKISNTSFNIVTTLKWTSNGYNHGSWVRPGNQAFFWIQRFKGGENFKFS